MKASHKIQHESTKKLHTLELLVAFSTSYSYVLSHSDFSYMLTKNCDFASKAEIATGNLVKGTV